MKQYKVRSEGEYFQREEKDTLSMHERYSRKLLSEYKDPWRDLYRELSEPQGQKEDRYK